MKPKKKCVPVFLLLALLILSGCTPIAEKIPETTSIYATFYPLYALTEMIANGAENVEVHCLVQPQDDCIRSYELSDWDLYMLTYSADALIAAGNGLEGFSNKLKLLGETSLPVAEVMVGLDQHQMGPATDEESHFSGENPHLYMSASESGHIAERIANTLMLFDRTNAPVYQQNLVRFSEQLSNLPFRSPEQTEVCTDVPSAVLHEALFYTAKDCGLDVRTWFERESGEMLYGSSLDECLNRLSENGIKMVLLEKQAPSALISTLEDSGYTVVKLDVMSTLSEADGPDVYFKTLENNVQAVADACALLNN